MARSWWRVALVGCMMSLAMLSPAFAQSNADMAWDLVKESVDARVIERFIEQFPDSPHVDDARVRLDMLEDRGGMIVPQGDERATTPPPDETPLPAAPDTERELFAAAVEINTEAGWRAFLQTYPNGPYSTLANAALQGLLSGAPAAPAAPVVPQPDPVQLALQVQTELNRLGCSVGRPDGVWGSQSRRALASFARYAGVSLGTTEPTADLVTLLNDKTGRVCPATCTVKQVLRNGVCVAKTCPAGQRLSSKGQCYKPSSGGGGGTAGGGGGGGGNAGGGGGATRCFVFNGDSFCE
ncbi:hypothetical protein [Devosia sp. CN2-171]|uniref:peptidoglycan-binding domain-containing protein n=1 Tax=Devosia sp. CN2-171 TaxID=3400909 RepID=UPI003BF89FCC